jgi:hypothetical protein
MRGCEVINRPRARLVLALAIALIATWAPAALAGAALAPILDRIAWGESSAALARALGHDALHLKPPLDFGDSDAELALRDERLGGFPFAVYFQMDKASHGLKRVMLMRQPHGANPAVFRAVIAALARDYGTPARCRGELRWTTGGSAIRAVFRDTTIEAGEGCTAAAQDPCGSTGRLFVQIVPQGAAGCG